MRSFNMKVRASVIGLGLVLVVGGIYAMVRGSASPGAAPRAAQAEAAKADAPHDGPATVQFEPESLRLADLQLETVQVHSVQARLNVTGTVEPDLGGVVKI